MEGVPRFEFEERPWAASQSQSAATRKVTALASPYLPETTASKQPLQPAFA